MNKIRTGRPGHRDHRPRQGQARHRDAARHRRDRARRGVDGVNVAKKHVKPNPLKGTTTGGVVDKAMPIQQSNVAIFNPATGKADRVGIKLLDDGKKVRVFKSSGEEIKA